MGLYSYTPSVFTHLIKCVIGISDTAFSATLRTSSPYPHSYVADLARKKRACIVELSSISTTCGLQHDQLRPLTLSIHNEGLLHLLPTYLTELPHVSEPRL